MVKASMWCLTSYVHKEWCVGFYYRNDKESHSFQRQKPLILHHDVDTDISLTYLSSFSINQQFCCIDLLLIKVGAFHKNLYLSPNMFVTLQEENYMAKLYLFLAIYRLYHKEHIGKFESVSIDFEIQLDSLEVPLNCIVCRYKTIRAVCNLAVKHKLMMIVVV